MALIYNLFSAQLSCKAMFFFLHGVTEKKLLSSEDGIIESFGKNLNFKLADISRVLPAFAPSDKDDIRFNGSIGDITSSFEEIRKDYFQLSSTRGYLFDATLNLAWYVYEVVVPEYLITNDVYFVDVTLMLDDGNSCLTDDMIYSIILTR